MKTILTAAKLFLAMTVLTGVLYPLVMTGAANLLFPARAGGSLATQKGIAIGSELVGQRFASPKYFSPRPSAVDYNPMPSGGSNWGPTSDTLKSLIDGRRARWHSTLGTTAEVPVDLLCASGSGLDPDISPEAARFQIPCVLKARDLDRMTASVLLALIEGHTEPPALGILGEPRVNVLRLNLALDSLSEAMR